MRALLSGTVEGLRNLLVNQNVHKTDLLFGNRTKVWWEKITILQFLINLASGSDHTEQSVAK